MNPLPRLPIDGPVTPVPSPILQSILIAARDPATDIAKLERLASMFEGMQAAEAEAAFAVAMSETQGRIRRILADSDNSHCKSRYASLAAIDAEVRDAYVAAGFCITFDEGTGEAGPDAVRLYAHVMHVAPGALRGHTRAYKTDCPADGKGARGGDVQSRTHAHKSALTYARRALIEMIFNVAVRRDDDGNAAGTLQDRQRSPQESVSADGITLRQLKELRMLIKCKAAREDHVLKACRVQALEDLTPRLYAQAKAKLEAMDDRKERRPL